MTTTNNNNTTQTTPIALALGVGMDQFADFRNMFAQKQQSFFEKAQDEFSSSMAVVVKGMTPKYTSNVMNRCRMPFQRLFCKRPRNVNDPDGLCLTCRKRNNSSCVNGSPSYFEYWNPNPDPNNGLVTPQLKVRGIERTDGRVQKRRGRPPGSLPPASLYPASFPIGPDLFVPAPGPALVPNSTPQFSFYPQTHSRAPDPAPGPALGPATVHDPAPIPPSPMQQLSSSVQKLDVEDEYDEVEILRDNYEGIEGIDEMVDGNDLLISN